MWVESGHFLFSCTCGLSYPHHKMENEKAPFAAAAAGSNPAGYESSSSGEAGNQAAGGESLRYTGFGRNNRESGLFIGSRCVSISSRNCLILIGVSVVVVGLVVLSIGILAGAVGNGRSAAQNEICSNPPLLLVSLDGFWSGYFQRSQYFPYLQSLASNGVRATFMRSAFPTETFPNHYSIVTGLYPESHGIVGSSFYDTGLGKKFNYRNGNSNNPEWWLGEPIWVTANKSNLNTGIYFWPGSEAEIQGFRPTYYFKYDRSVPFEDRVRTVLGWLDEPSSSRPQFMAVYFNEPDHAGHGGGPNSQQVNEALTKVDNTIKSLFEGLKIRGLIDCVNVMFVSDHGMAASDLSKEIYLPSYIPSDLTGSVTYTTNTVTSNINVNGGSNNIQRVYEALLENGTKAGAPFSVYLKENIPFRLHAGHHNKQRYGDILVIGELGSFIANNQGYNPPTGVHGYDNALEEMQAIFVGHGPAFKTKYVSDPFNNTELYNLMCGLLNIQPAVNNGTAGSLNHLIKK